ncbi:MAG TPA: acyltransferase [Macromonas sp.]|nr:acyltransferase [Macromonas sp.]
MTAISANPGRGVGQRMPLIDALKAVCSQLIVLHHLAFYGPMSDWTNLLVPDVVSWFSQYARIAVQVFLVVGGFLAARSLAPDGVLLTTSVARTLWQRYQRVVLPFVAALLVAMVCSEMARAWMVHDSVPDAPTLGQFLAHALLLHSVFDVDSLSAGVWYVAIDFQLYVLLLALLWLARRGPAKRKVGAALVAVLAVLSLLYFNLDSDWDVWALYFFGAYGLGALTHWANRPAADAPFLRYVAWLLVLAVALLALALAFRERLAVALSVAVVLGVAQRGQWLQRWPDSRVLGYFGKISYSVFLLNFPVALLVNALFTRFAPADVWWQTLGVLLAWVACNVVGAVFYRWVEAPLGRWGRTAGTAGDTVTSGHAFNNR